MNGSLSAALRNNPEGRLIEHSKYSAERRCLAYAGRAAVVPIAT